MAEYKDDGVSGMASAKLIGRREMFADAEREAFDVVVVEAFDRLARDDEKLRVLVHRLLGAGVACGYSKDHRILARFTRPPAS